MLDRILTGRVVTPSGVIEQGWIGIAGGCIAAMGACAPEECAMGEGALPPAQAVHRHDGAWLLPGGIDAQSHAGSYWGLDGLGRTTRAALAGGVTTLVEMPFDTPQPLSTLALLQDKIDAVHRDAACDVALYATVAPGQGVGELAALARAGICGIKISVCESHPTRFPRIPADQQHDLLRAAARLGLPVGVHNEDQEIVRASTARIRARGLGDNPLLDHDACRPRSAELAATALFVELAAEAGAHAHIVHISTPAGFDILRRYRRDGHVCTGEICVHYLIFDPAESGVAQGARLKVNPPLRPGVRDALWARIAEGAVACVSSDHSTMSLANKDGGSFFDAGPGMPGLETMIPVFFTAAEARGLDAPRLVAQLFAAGPAALFGLAPRKGALKIGAEADVMVLEPGRFTHDSTRSQDGVGWSPYDGMTFSVRVAATYLRGAPAWDGRAIVAQPGQGRFVPRAG